MNDQRQAPPCSDRESLLVVMPTYNEAANLEVIVGRVRAAVPAAHILVVDDNSPDGTAAIADRLAISDGHVHALHRPGKEGLGAAYVAGFRWALCHGYDVLVQMDADGSHRPEQLPSLLARLRDADMVIGSRWVPGGEAPDWPRWRRLISRGGTAYARRALGLPVRDLTGGYRAIRRTAVEALDVDTVVSQGYCFQIEMAWRAVQRDWRVAEVPISFMDRQYGRSKMSGAIVREALWRVTVWGIERGAARFRGRRKPPAALGDSQAAGTSG